MLATPKYSKAIKISYLLGGGRQLESSENDYDGPGRFLKRVIGTNTPKCIVYSGGVMSICKQWENTAEKNLSEEREKKSQPRSCKLS